MSTVTMSADLFMVIVGVLGMLVFTAACFPFFKVGPNEESSGPFPGIIWVMCGLFGAVSFLAGIGEGFYLGVTR